MILELKGKGIVSDIYYLTEVKFLALTTEAADKSLGLSSLITKYCDYHIPVSRGFFSDNPNTTCNLVRDTGELISVPMGALYLADEILNGKEKSEIPKDRDDLKSNGVGRDFLVVRSYDEHPEPSNSQICLVAYSEFEYGTSATSFPLGPTGSLKELQFVTKSVDCEGFVRRATYEEDIVGSDEYNRAELAIMGIEIYGQFFEIAPPNFELSRNRVWLYKFDENEQSHQLDFTESKKIRWLSALDDQSKTRIIVK